MDKRSPTFERSGGRPVRVLHSFPHRLGKSRICAVAWYEIDGAASAGAEMTVVAGDCVRPFCCPLRLVTTFSRGRFRLPYKILGTRRMCMLHDRLVARRLPSLRGQIDVIHAWPMGALRTIRKARDLGIPCLLERPNAHTEYAYRVVREECRKLNVSMPPGHEHDFNEPNLRLEEAEYAEASGLLCPSDFVARTFQERGFAPEKLLRHQYGYDEKVFYPGAENDGRSAGLTMLFAGGCAPRKGLHYALEAWLKSPAHRDGTFLVAGAFIPGYAERLAEPLSHPSVRLLGHRTDLPELMRQSDVFVLPSIEEGSALVTSEARGSGCVLLVSEATGAPCRHNENALVHPVGEIGMLTEQITLLDRNREFLREIRQRSLATVHEITWMAAGRRLLAVYRSTAGGD
jgi:D-inositol-3-phosphate glycosyltransferase